MISRRMPRAMAAAAVLAVAAVTWTTGQAPSSTPRTRPPAAPAPRAERAVPFRAGETLTYDVSWSTYLTAGTATVTVREKRASAGSLAYYIVAEGQPTPLLSKLYTLYYKADTLLDAYTLLPQRGSVFSQEGGRKRFKITRFDQGARKASYEVQTATVATKDLVLPPYTQDALSAVYILRAVPLSASTSITIPVSDSGKVYRVRLTVGGREMVRAGIGTVNCWKVSPVILDATGKATSDRRLLLWISDDARRLPVKMQADLAVGSFNLTLRDARM